MFLRIENIEEKKLVGNRIQTTLSANKTAELWQKFMPRKKTVTNTVDNNLFSVQIFNDLKVFEDFGPDVQFEKWAAVEVKDHNTIPEEMEAHTLAGGLYAVFLHKGAASNYSTHNYIFTNWLPNSEYLLDNREHFEIMGEKYKGNVPDSEEEVWIPIKKRQ